MDRTSNIDITFDIDVDKLIKQDKEAYQEYIRHNQDPLGYYEGVGGR